MPIRLDHAWALQALPTHHKDPFDRMLIVQSQLEGIPIISCDGQFQAYDVDVIW